MDGAQAAKARSDFAGSSRPTASPPARSTPALSDPPASARCWGSNSLGQLGNGTTSIRRPRSASPGSPTRSASVRATGSRGALRSTGRLRAGATTYGRLGNGTTTDSTTPVAVSGIADAIAVDAGTAPDMRPSAHRPARMLGCGFLRGARQRRQRRLPDTRRGRRRHGRSRNLRRQPPHLCRTSDRQGCLLGAQPARPTGQRHDR